MRYRFTGVTARPDRRTTTARESATRSSARAPLARWLRGSAAVLLTLAAPAASAGDALTTGHTGLTRWGIILVAAPLIGVAAGMLVAARRGLPGRPHYGPAATRSVQAGPATTVSGQARPSTKEALIFRRITGQSPRARQAHRARRRNLHSAAATPAHQRHPVQISPADPAAGSWAGPYSPHPWRGWFRDTAGLAKGQADGKGNSAGRRGQPVHGHVLGARRAAQS